MKAMQAYLELHKGPRRALVLVSFLIASLALYVVIAVRVVGIPGASPNFLWDSVLPLFCILLALICDVAIAWMLHEPLHRRFWSVLTLVSAAILVGTTLVSVAIWRGNWLELVKEIFGLTGTMR